ncbi:hypothetical protein ACQ4PT_011437 [Festuca glaucescens]
METTGVARTSTEFVLGTANLLMEIMQRLGCTRYVDRSSLVSKIWLAVARSDVFGRAYMKRNRPACIGFVVEFSTEDGRQVHLVGTGDVHADLAVQDMAASFRSADMCKPYILSCSEGFILSLEEMPLGYYTRRLCNSRTVRKFVCPRIPPLPHIQGEASANMYGQYGVIPEAGSSDMAFFVKDAPRLFDISYHGANYSVGQHQSGSIALVQFSNGSLVSWVLERREQGDVWRAERSLYLVSAFGGRFQTRIWQLVRSKDIIFEGSNLLYSVQVRTTSLDGQFIFLKLGFYPAGIFVADMVNHSVLEVRNMNVMRDGKLGRAFTLMESWTPQIRVFSS